MGACLSIVWPYQWPWPWNASRRASDHGHEPHQDTGIAENSDRGVVASSSVSNTTSNFKILLNGKEYDSDSLNQQILFFPSIPFGIPSGRASDHGHEPHQDRGMAKKAYFCIEHKVTNTNEGRTKGMAENSDRGIDTTSNLKVRLNDSVYQLHKPTGSPNMQILFFHGLQFGDGTDAHVSTWETGKGSEAHIWPQTWLVEKFPRAHVLSVSYDARVRQGDGNLDLDLIGENLTSDLVAAGVEIGQNPRCPVILVGHCFGGLVIKQLCLHAHRKVSSTSSSASLNFAKLDNFLRNVKAIFFYGTPHHGVPLENIAGYFVGGGPLLPFVKILSKPASRLNDDFDGLVKGLYKNAWLIGGLGENKRTKWGRFNKVVVPEASARYGHSFNVVATDHITICKPETKESRSFLALTELISDAIRLDLRGNLPVHKLQGLPVYAVDLQKRAKEIERKLRDKQVLGIVGMGGIGKTTLAKFVFNNISWRFEYTCFVDNVKGREKHKLEGCLVNNFYRNGRRVDRVGWSDLQDKTTLIVLDDVGSDQMLSDVLPYLQNFGSNTRVIITTRDRSVLKQYDDNKYVCHEVDFLAENDAHKLFCKHAFDQEEIPRSTGKELESEVRDFLKKCDGLPLTLEVMGRYLRGQQKRGFWREAIERLGEAQAIGGGKSDRVWASLRVSYDDLSSVEQKVFVRAATCFFEEPLERALAAWSTGCEYPETAWENLMARCLVKEVAVGSVFDGKQVWVHEHLRDLAHKIAPDKMMVARGIGKAETLLNAEQRAEAISRAEFLRVSCQQTDERKKLQVASLLNLKKLKYMELEGVQLEGTTEKLPQNLSLLRWENGGSQPRRLDRKPQPVTFQSRIPPGVLAEVFKDCRVTVQRFESYRELQEDEDFQFFPVSWILNMDNLAVLELRNWQISLTFPAALGNLTKLRILYLDHIKGMDSFPVAWNRLRELKHMGLRQFIVSELSESFGDLQALENLEFNKSFLTKLPQSFGNLHSLVTLKFYNEEKLIELPESFGDLRSLVTLEFYAVQLKELPEPFGKLCSLVTLKFNNMYLMKLPQSFGNLHSLVNLSFDRVRLTELPESFGKLRSLVNLEFKEVPLEKLPQSFGILSSLVTLLFSQVNLTELPQSFGNLHSLLHLKFYGVGLTELPESFKNLNPFVERSGVFWDIVPNNLP